MSESGNRTPKLLLTMANPEVHGRFVEAVRIGMAKPEVHERMSKSLKKAWTPERRARLSERQKKAWRLLLANKGRPRKDAIRARVTELRAEGKSWAR